MILSQPSLWLQLRGRSTTLVSSLLVRRRRIGMVGLVEQALRRQQKLSPQQQQQQQQQQRITTVTGPATATVRTTTSAFSSSIWRRLPPPVLVPQFLPMSSGSLLIREGKVAVRNYGTSSSASSAQPTVANSHDASIKNGSGGGTGGGGSREVVKFLRLNNLRDNPGAVPKKRRVGRGIGSGRGKTCGRGHKGQKARSGGNVHPTFEGGQTKFYKRIPKRGMNNKRHATKHVPINLGRLQDYVTMGRIDAAQEITIGSMQSAGMFKSNAVLGGAGGKQFGSGGVKLLAHGKETLQTDPPLRITVNRASAAAIRAVELSGGTVQTIHQNRLALRTALLPHKFKGLSPPPKPARPPPKWQPYYTSWKHRGYLHPAVQLRQWFLNRKQHVKGEGDGDDEELEKRFDDLWARLGPPSAIIMDDDDDDSDEDVVNDDTNKDDDDDEW